MPHSIGPQLLSNISEPVHDENKKCENETATESAPKECQLSQNNTKCKANKTAEVTVKLLTNNRSSYEKSQAPDKQNEKLQTQTQQKQVHPQQIQHGTAKQTLKLNAVPELKEVQSFGSVDLIPVSSATKQDPKVHEKPVKNFVEITPLISGQNESISKKAEKSDDVPAQQPKVSTCIAGRFVSLSYYMPKCLLIKNSVISISQNQRLKRNQKVWVTFRLFLCSHQKIAIRLQGQN